MRLQEYFSYRHIFNGTSDMKICARKLDITVGDCKPFTESNSQHIACRLLTDHFLYLYLYPCTFLRFFSAQVSQESQFTPLGIFISLHSKGEAS